MGMQCATCRSTITRSQSDAGDTRAAMQARSAGREEEYEERMRSVGVACPACGIPCCFVCYGAALKCPRCGERGLFDGSRPPAGTARANPSSISSPAAVNELPQQNGNVMPLLVGYYVVIVGLFLFPLIAIILFPRGASKSSDQIAAAPPSVNQGAISKPAKETSEPPVRHSSSNEEAFTEDRAKESPDERTAPLASEGASTNQTKSVSSRPSESAFSPRNTVPTVASPAPVEPPEDQEQDTTQSNAPTHEDSEPADPSPRSEVSQEPQPTLLARLPQHNWVPDAPIPIKIPDSATTAVISSDAKRVVAITNQAIISHDAETGKRLRSISATRALSGTARPRPRGQRSVDAQSGDPVRNVIHGLAISPDGRTAVTGIEDDRHDCAWTATWDLDRGKMLAAIQHRTIRDGYLAASLAVSPNGLRFAMGTNSTVSYFSDWQGEQQDYEAIKGASGISAIGYSHDGNYGFMAGRAVNAGKPEVHVYAAGFGGWHSRRCIIRPAFGHVSSAALDVKGDTLWLAGSSRRAGTDSIIVFNCETGEPRSLLQTRSRSTGKIAKIAFSSNGTLALSLESPIAEPDTLRIWDCSTKQEVGRTNVGTSLLDVTFAGDSSNIVGVSNDAIHPFRYVEIDGPRRTWVDNTGQHKIEAELLAFEEPTVTLLKTNGKQAQVPLDRLSQPDQALVRYAADFIDKQ